MKGKTAVTELLTPAKKYLVVGRREGVRGEEVGKRLGRVGY